MHRKLVFIVCLFCSIVSTAQAQMFSKASDWVGRKVVTLDGDTVGEVEDFALDLSTGEIHYVVVSVGSFLIDDSLIAVDRRALRQAPGDDYLTLNAQNVGQAKRFSNDRWPDTADVLPAETDATLTAPVGETAGTGTPSNATNDRGTATISSGRKRATLSAGERRIEQIAVPVKTPVEYNEGLTPTAVNSGPLPAFERLDANKDGSLSRREIGARLSLNESYDAIDSDASGRIDRFEFDVFAESRKLNER